MKTLSLVIFCILFTLTVCKKDDSVIGIQDQETKIKFIRFINYGCANTNALEKPSQNEYYLKGYRLHKDTLTLTIHFPANCCPAFTEKITVADYNVNIALADTSPGCYCICEYNNDFTFLYSDSDQLNMKFQFRDYGEAEYTTKIDTLFQIM